MAQADATAANARSEQKGLLAMMTLFSPMPFVFVFVSAI
jgi:hypothetical protein